MKSDYAISALIYTLSVIVTATLTESRVNTFPTKIEALVLKRKDVGIHNQPYYSNDESNEPWESFDYNDSTFQKLSTKRQTPKITKKTKPQIYFFHVSTDIRYRYSKTLLTSRVANNHDESQEVTFSATIPDTAFVTKFTMEIGGKIYEAYVEEKEEAKRDYNDAKEQGQTAGIVEHEQNFRFTDVFSVKVNIEPQSKVTFNLTYEELLQRRLGVYEQVINIRPDQVLDVRDFQVQVNIEESNNITRISVPRLTNDIDQHQENLTGNLNAVISQPQSNVVNITWTPSADEHQLITQEGFNGKFIVQYDVFRDNPAGEILVMQGYFVHFFAPEDLPTLRKHVIFVLDVSGSMYGRKMRQMKKAQKTILNDLAEEDYFNIITFSSYTNNWYPDSRKRRGRIQNEFQLPIQATKINVDKAKDHIRSLRARGGTNINDALKQALNLTNIIRENSQQNYDELDGVTEVVTESEVFTTTITPKDDIQFEENSTMEENIVSLPQGVETMIMFLTDGEPTVGETNHDYILKNIRTENENISVPIYSLAFGEEADFPFVKKISLQNNGFARKIYEASDASLQLKGFYKEIASPLLSNVTFKYTNIDNATTTTQTKFANLFEGSEVAVAGQIDQELFPDVVEETTLSSNDEYTTLTSNSEDVISTTPTSQSSQHKASVQFSNIEIIASGREGEIIFNAPTVNYVRPYGNDALCPYPPRPTPVPTADDIFLERLWAHLTIRQLLDKDFAESKSENQTSDDPANQALTLALKYHFVTPLTSLVVVQPNKTTVAKLDGNAQSTAQPLPQLSHFRPPSNLGVITTRSGNKRRKHPSTPIPMAHIDQHVFGLVGPRESPRPIRPVFSTTPLPPTSTTPGPLDDIAWIHPKDSYFLTVNGTDYAIKTYDTVLAVTAQTNQQTVPLCKTHLKTIGACLHFIECIQSEFVDNKEKYLQDYFCPIIDEARNTMYAGVCCM